MTIAEIHGKAQNTSSEDLLTANVFTAFRYLPTASGIVGFLRSIPGMNEIIPKLWEAPICEYYFWPRGRFREPDVLLELNLDGRIVHVLVEAKYESGPSDSDIVDIVIDGDTAEMGIQLADEFRGLSHGSYRVFEAGKRSRSIQLTSRVEDRFLLYLTADVKRPADKLKRALLSNPDLKDKLFWSSWNHIYDYLIESSESFSSFPFNLVWEDILALFTKKQFSTFGGMNMPPEIPMSGIAKGFWRGDRDLTPIFPGIPRPPLLNVKERNGSFYRGRANG